MQIESKLNRSHLFKNKPLRNEEKKIQLHQVPDPSDNLVMMLCYHNLVKN